MNIGKIARSGFAALVLTATAAQAQYSTYDTWDYNYTVQALLGAVQFENLKIDDSSGSGGTTEIDMSLLPQLGAAWGTVPKGDRFQYGLETSFLLGFQFDDINFVSAGGHGLYVSISTSMWMFDFSGGPYASLFLDRNRNIRLYAAGGPLMVYADYSSDREETPDGPGDSETYKTHESAFGLGLYARAGFEFRLYEKGMLGLGVRGTWSNVDLTDVGGSSDLTGMAAFISFTAGL